MKDKYDLIYKQLVSAYYNNSFEETLQQILNTEFEDKSEGKEVIATLCGVDTLVTKDDYQFIFEIIDSITNKRVREKIVQKVHSCGEDCENTNGKSKCQSICPLDAIVKIPLTNDKYINEDLCINCGRCISVCDNGNYLETSQFLPLAQLLKENDNVVAIVAPAIAGQYGNDVSLDQLREAMVKIGFKDMVEVALAADILSIKEAVEFNLHVKDDNDFMITSCCCPVWVAMLRKKYNNLIKEVSPSVSPMVAMGRIVKALDKNSKVVFIGPCMAKKAEAKEADIKDAVDYVLTFQELKLIFDAMNINPKDLKGIPSIDYASRGGRLYARTGGVSQAVWDIVDQLFPEKRKIFSSTQADGIKGCKQILDDLENKKVVATFIEGMACEGGCVGGPKAIIPKDEGKIAVEQEAYDSAIKIPVHSEILLNLLSRLGVNSLEDFNTESSMFERKF